MKNSIKQIIYLVFNFFYIQGYSQEFSISIVPYVSVGAADPSVYKLVSGKSFYKPERKSSYSGDLIDQDGKPNSYTLNTVGYGADILFRTVKKSNGNAWGLLVGINRQSYLQYVGYTPYAFKGYTIESFYESYRGTNAQVGIRKEFLFDSDENFGWYIQGSAIANFQTQSRLFSNGVWENFSPKTLSFYQNGTGYISEYSVPSSPSKALSLIPELGLLSRGKVGIDVSISYQIPVISSLYTLRSTYYVGGLVYGIQEANRTQQSLWLKLKVPIRLFNFKKTEHIPKTTPTVKPPVQSPTVESNPIQPMINVNGRTLKRGEIIPLNSIQFEQGKSELFPDGEKELDKIVELMIANPSLIIELSGHTSNEGDEDENIKLSKRRVTVCKDYIAGRGTIANNRVRTIGYGSSKPRVPNNSDENRRKNRRVELKVESL